MKKIVGKQYKNSESLIFHRKRPIIGKTTIRYHKSGIRKIKYVKQSDSEKYCEGKMKRNSGSCGEKEQEIFILKESKNEN